MPRHGEEIWVPALILVGLVAFHLFAARMGKAGRAALARRRAQRAARSEGRSHDHLLKSNESIEPE